MHFKPRELRNIWPQLQYLDLISDVTTVLASTRKINIIISAVISVLFNVWSTADRRIPVKQNWIFF